MGPGSFLFKSDGIIVDIKTLFIIPGILTKRIKERGETMNRYETIINSDLLEKSIKVPVELKHRKVRILIMLADEGDNKKLNLRGALEKYNNPEKTQEEKKAWEAHSIGKHDHGNRRPSG